MMNKLTNLLLAGRMQIMNSFIPELTMCCLYSVCLLFTCHPLYDIPY